ncbi:MAG TPA: glycosyltransferase, partial [Chloroflexaceae bacterium]|nr:glycosyltransferase [Chloroflexaceae bacterium]
MGHPLVGVVTPVYNGAAFLAEAIESVLAQSYPHWRYAILDNLSDDDSYAIARAYAARDPRITVARNAAHLPMLASWNAAMALLPAEAAYCKVLHADDTLLPRCLELMVGLAEAHPRVVVVGAQRRQGEALGLTGLAPGETVVPGRELGRRFLLDGLTVFGSPTSTLLRAEAVRRRDPFYNEANLHADTEAMLDLLREGDFGFVHEPLTVTRVHAERTTTFARRMNSFLPGNLRAIRRYGRFYLDEGEYRALLARKERQYDRFLAQALLARRERAFWAFHRREGEGLGRPLTAPRLARATAAFVAERAGQRLGLGPRPTGGPADLTPQPPLHRGEGGPSPLPKVSFGIIVLNGEPFTRYCLRALYPFAHEIIVVEGAAPGAAGVATPDGHSTDGTLEALRRFQAEEDPAGKLRLITRDGFWSEKDEQSRAYAAVATGDYLWQVDIDEFYAPGAMWAVLELLARRPEVAAVSFRELKFWGGFDYTVDGWHSRRGANLYHRLFRWGPGYSYVTHRPPTVADAEGRDLRALGYLGGDELAAQGILLHHYALVFPKQVLNKSAYYGRAAWAGRPESQRWAEECWLRLGRPYRVHNVYAQPSWLERYGGRHPPQIEAMRADLEAGRLREERRATDDVERLLRAPWYTLGR